MVEIPYQRKISKGIKIRTIEGSAVAVSLIATIICILFGVLSDTPLIYGILAPVVTFLVTCAGAHFVFTRFVLFRIKPIYQILLSRNIKTHELAQRRDVMEGIHDQLYIWAEKNAKEISRLKDNEKYRKEFLGDVSHEIKTPIFTLQGYILTLLDGGLEDETINRKYLERSEKSIDRLINIVNELEEISLLESGVLKLDYERFDITLLAREVAESMEMQASKQEIKMKVGLGVNQPPMFVYADRKRVTQIFVNLITNSIKYGRKEGVTKIGFIDVFDKVMIEVKDNGIGVAEENIPRLFERFFRVDKSRSREQGGTGLGLAIVKHIVEAHNQTVTVRSSLGEGSTFSFTLSKK